MANNRLHHFLRIYANHSIIFSLLIRETNFSNKSRRARGLRYPTTATDCHVTNECRSRIASSKRWEEVYNVHIYQQEIWLASSLDSIARTANEQRDVVENDEENGNANERTEPNRTSTRSFRTHGNDHHSISLTGWLGSSLSASSHNVPPAIPFAFPDCMHGTPVMTLYRYTHCVMNSAYYLGIVRQCVVVDTRYGIGRRRA